MQKVQLVSRMPDRGNMEFVGEQLCQVSSRQDTTQRGSRLYDLSVYRTEQGLFVAVVDFQSAVADETGGLLAEELDSIKDVEDFYFAFEPDELVDERMRSQLDAEDLQSLLQRLYHLYEETVQDLMSQLAKTRATPAHP